jgi:isoquinoline 1-oxidoreductase beta subunit
VHNFYLGGGFGRRLEVDNVIQAVAFAKLAKGPLKIVWTREEDIQHDMYRPYYLDRLSARLDDKGMPIAWFHRVTGSSIMARFAPPLVKNGVDPDAVEGAAELQYTIPDMRVEYVRHEPPGVPPRSGAASARPTTCSWSRASSTNWPMPARPIRWPSAARCCRNRRARWRC